MLDMAAVISLMQERKGAVLEKDVAFLRILFKFNTKKL